MDDRGGSRRGEQLRDGLAVGNNWSRAASVVGNLDALEVDPEVPIDRGEKVLGTDAAVNYVLAATVGPADDLARRNAAACPDHRVGLWPVIAAGLHRPRRCAGHAAAAARNVGDVAVCAELAGDDDQDSLIQSTVIDVFNQCGYGLVKIRSPEAERLKDVMIDGVVVPVRALGRIAVRRMLW